MKNNERRQFIHRRIKADPIIQGEVVDMLVREWIM